MKTKLYYIDCLTNLHVGSGDANFNIVDKEVEKDPITGDPIIHTSGIKGALRDAFRIETKKREEEKAAREEKELKFFGKPATEKESDTGGTYKFFDAHMLYRPLRAKGGECPYINVTTVEAVNRFIDLIEAFGISVGVNKINIDFPEKVNFLTSEDRVQVEGEASKKKVNFLTSKDCVQVEGEVSKKLDDENIRNLTGLFGENFAIAASLDDYDLPVIARNNLQGKGNLWYEEYVPHGSRFFMLVIVPDDATDDEVATVIPEIAQIGGNASVGYGYCRFDCKGGNA